MKSAARTLLAIAVLICPAIGSAQLGGPAADMGAINNLLAELLRNYQERNVAGMSGLMATELQAYGSTFNATSLQDWRNKVSNTLTSVRGVRVVGKQDVTMSGNLAYVAFLTDVQREAPAGVTTGRARWSVVFQKSNNRWVVVHYHVSPDPTGRTQ